MSSAKGAVPADDNKKLPILQKEHPNSRKTKRKYKEESRDAKLRMGKKMHKQTKEQPMIDMVKFFRDELIKLGISTVNPRICTPEEFFVICVEWTCRKDAELKEVNEKLSQMLHPTSSVKNKRDRLIDEIKMIKNEFIGGMNIPDLSDLENVKFILNVKDIYITIKQMLKLKTVKYADKDSISQNDCVQCAIIKFEEKI